MNQPKQCGFCPNSKKDYYTCPKCNAPYCSLKCYRSPVHLQCTETFYKQCVQDEMRLLSKSQEAKRKTVEALKNNLNEEELDSDDETDLSDRLAGVDLEDSGAIWNSLTPNERSEFRSLVESGEISKFVPEFKPWWDYRFRPAKKVQPLEESQQEVEKFTEQMTARIPQVMEKIPNLGQLLGPAGVSNLSPTVKYGVLNVVYAYAFTHRLYRGSITEDDENLNEFPTVLLTVCGALNSPRPQNFDSAELALQAGVTAVVEHGHLLSTSDEDAKAVRKDVLKIVRGPGIGLGSSDNLYLISALSHLRRTLKKSVKTGAKNQIKLAIKKLEFYLSWISVNYEELIK